MILTVRSTVIRLNRWEGSLLYVQSSDNQNNSAVSNADSYGPELKRKAERIAKLYKLKIATSFPPISQREIGSSLVDLSGCEGVRPLDRYDSSFILCSALSCLHQSNSGRCNFSDERHVWSSFSVIGRFNRKILLPLLISQWKGWVLSFYLMCSPIIFVFHLKEEELSTFRQFISQTRELCNSRVTLLGYISKAGSFFYNNYPINILRNIGIHHTHTTHYALLDIDMIPSGSRLEELCCRYFLSGTEVSCISGGKRYHSCHHSRVF